MQTYFQVAQVLVSIILILAILLQSKGSSFSGTFSNDSSVFRTRRGVEKTLFQLTIGICVLFLILSLATSIIAGHS